MSNCSACFAYVLLFDIRRTMIGTDEEVYHENMYSCLRCSAEMQTSFRCSFCYTHNTMSKSSREPSDTAPTLASQDGPGGNMPFIKLELQWEINSPKISKDLQKEAVLNIFLTRQWSSNRKQEGEPEIPYHGSSSNKHEIIKSLCLIWKDAGVRTLSLTSDWLLLMIWGISS